MGLFDKAIDKTLNKAVKIENITLTPEQLVSMTDARLLTNCSQEELKNIQKGVQKTWVLSVGQGTSSRYYPSWGSPVHLVVNFNALTHLLSSISLLDKEARKEYFLPKGKENVTQFQTLLLQKISERL